MSSGFFAPNVEATYWPGTDQFGINLFLIFGIGDNLIDRTRVIRSAIEGLIYHIDFCVYNLPGQNELAKPDLRPGTLAGPDSMAISAAAVPSLLARLGNPN